MWVFDAKGFWEKIQVKQRIPIQDTTDILIFDLCQSIHYVVPHRVLRFALAHLCLADALAFIPSSAYSIRPTSRLPFSTICQATNDVAFGVRFDTAFSEITICSKKKPSLTKILL